LIGSAQRLPQISLRAIRLWSLNVAISLVLDSRALLLHLAAPTNRMDAAARAEHDAQRTIKMAKVAKALGDCPSALVNSFQLKHVSPGLVVASSLVSSLAGLYLLWPKSK
jgi:hypothetical protein